MVELDRAARAPLRRAAAAFRSRLAAPIAPPRADASEAGSTSGAGTRRIVRGRTRALAAAALVFGLSAALYLGSELGYASPTSAASTLVISFKHPGRTEEACRTLTEQERAALPVHMRTDRVCERRRADVRLRVLLDGREALQRTYPPHGPWGDGSSIAIERLEVSPGRHRIDVSLGDTVDPSIWSYRDERALDFTAGTRRVMLFDRLTGFSWR
jgi:hypothetical protein